MCKEVHRVRVLYVHVFVSVYNFLRWNKINKIQKKKKKFVELLSYTKSQYCLLRKILNCSLLGLCSLDQETLSKT